MKVSVNNKLTETDDKCSVAQLAALLNLPPQGVAVAVNNRMVPRTLWEEHILREGDNVVVIKAACGG